MPVKIRLQRKGRRKRPFYHIVIADARAPRDGKFIEKIGTYNPMTVPATIDLDRTAAYDWLLKGAQPTDTVRAILRFKGVLYRKHLMRGVAKGALTQEEADKKYQEWIDAKEGTTAERRAAQEEKEAEFRAAVSGTPPPAPEPEPEAVEETETAEATASTEEEAGSTEESRAAAADVAGEAKAEADAAEAAGEALAEANEGEGDAATGDIDKEV
ncbi:small subunit ribosomal protein S16 [Lewinella marina]|uniref:Small ribosomal subunit protein bS16 n=1 Tax=Neolewinella marina TaxID=438751 RepID=A0A2G0CFH5_9BACT|nr:30S ribosomal protein S16 [Neolewinella marina]NJB85591.1 small subunit ribosomal protein S16 [Neolewinella marina]PHK98725.1 30S ribosomal protein S16 [Neolewinella marina]